MRRNNSLIRKSKKKSGLKKNLLKQRTFFVSGTFFLNFLLFFSCFHFIFFVLFWFGFFGLLLVRRYFLTRQSGSVLLRTPARTTPGTSLLGQCPNVWPVVRALQSLGQEIYFSTISKFLFVNHQLRILKARSFGTFVF